MKLYFQLLFSKVAGRFGVEPNEPLDALSRFASEKILAALTPDFFSEQITPELTPHEHDAARILLFCLEDDASIRRNIQKMESLLKNYLKSIGQRSKENDEDDNQLPNLSLTAIGFIAFGVILNYQENSQIDCFHEKKQRFFDIIQSWGPSESADFQQRNKENMVTGKPAETISSAPGEILKELGSMLENKSRLFYTFGQPQRLSCKVKSLQPRKRKHPGTESTAKEQRAETTVASSKTSLFGPQTSNNKGPDQPITPDHIN